MRTIPPYGQTHLARVYYKDDAIQFLILDAVTRVDVYNILKERHQTHLVDCQVYGLYQDATILNDVCNDQFKLSIIHSISIRTR